MIKIPLSQEVNLDLLTEELFTASPEWVDGDGRTTAVIRRDYLWLPENTDVDKVLAVVSTHDKNNLSQNQKNPFDFESEINNANSIAALKKVLLRLVGNRQPQKYRPGRR